MYTKLDMLCWSAKCLLLVIRLSSQQRGIQQHSKEVLYIYATYTHIYLVKIVCFWF